MDLAVTAPAPSLSAGRPGIVERRARPRRRLRRTPMRLYQAASHTTLLRISFRFCLFFVVFHDISAALFATTPLSNRSADRWSPSLSVHEKHGSILPKRNCHVRNLLILDHRGDALQVLIGGRAHSPAPGPVVLARDHKMMTLPRGASTEERPILPIGNSSLISS